MCDVRCTVYGVRYAVCGVRCTGVRCTVCGVRCALCGVRCTEYDDVRNTAHGTPYTTAHRCTPHIVHRTPYTTHLFIPIPESSTNMRGASPPVPPPVLGPRSRPTTTLGRPLTRLSTHLLLACHLAPLPCHRTSLPCYVYTYLAPLVPRPAPSSLRPACSSRSTCPYRPSAAPQPTTCASCE